MSAVKKTAKTALFIFGGIVLLIVVVGSYIFLNLNSIAKNFSEKAASEALGVPVSIGEMDIRLDEKKIVVNDVAVANPKGYKNEYAITIKNITVDGESFSKDLLVFTLIQVDGTAVNLEVNEKGANLGKLKQSSQQTVQQTEQVSEAKASDPKSEIKVIVRKFALAGAQITPSVTLLRDASLSAVKVNDIVVNGIGEKENGVTSEEAIAQIMNVVLDKFNGRANSAGFLEGMSLDSLNAIGVSTGEVFQKNLKKSYDGEVDKLKKGFDGLKSLFE
jgi:hypothetical protein